MERDTMPQGSSVIAAFCHILGRKKCERCKGRAVRGERFCLRHREQELRAMRRDGYLTKVIWRPYFTEYMNDPDPLLITGGIQ